MKNVIIILLSLIGITTLTAQTGWYLEPSNFAYNMPVLTTANSPCQTLGDQIAAFDSNNNLRGYSPINTGQNSFFMDVFSDVTNNETLHFKYYDADSDEIFNLPTETFQFSSTGVIGIPDPLMVSTIETVPPVAKCMNATIYLNTFGIAILSTEAVDDNSTDNCSVIELGLETRAFDCAQEGSNTVTLTVTDASGNKDSCSAIVTVLDSIKPTVICANSEVYLDALGEGTIQVSDIDNSSIDNCNIDSLSLSKSNFTCTDLGDQIVYLIATDASGNKDSCRSMVMVIDTLKPLLECLNSTVYLDGDGLQSIDTSVLINTTTDNCTISSVSLDKSTFDCAVLGLHEIEITVVDQSGNTTKCTSEVMVLDSIKPTVTCRPATTYLDDSGMVIIDPARVESGSSDNCSITSRTLNKNQFICDEVGSQEVILTVKDASGNTSSCKAIVSVIDSIRPVAQCKNIEVILDQSGNGVLQIANVDNGSTDNCSIGGSTLSKTMFSKFEDRSQEVNLTTVDASGNRDSCIAQITIVNTFENDKINCTDGIDNDADGLVDCNDPECGTPAILEIIKTEPTPLSCTAAASDGSIEISHTGAELFSIDNGAISKTENVFTGLDTGTYKIWIQDDLAACTDTALIALTNTFDPFPPARAISLSGPNVICPGSKAVNYSIEGIIQGLMTWEYSGADAAIQGNTRNANIDYGIGLTSGVLKATLNTTCTSSSSDLQIGIANPFLCESFSNCVPSINVSNDLLENANISQVYHASEEILSNASLSNNSFEFKAGQSINLGAGFSVETGANFVADIKNCSK